MVRRIVSRLKLLSLGRLTTRRGKILVVLALICFPFWVVTICWMLQEQGPQQDEGTGGGGGETMADIEMAEPQKANNKERKKPRD